MKYGVRIESKHTGESCVLGSQFDSREKAKEYAEREVCQRCNRWEYVYIPHEDAIWVDRKTGFRSLKMHNEIMREKMHREKDDNDIPAVLKRGRT
jgi:hypothetical protein